MSHAEQDTRDLAGHAGKGAEARHDKESTACEVRVPAHVVLWPSVVAWQDQPSGQQSLAPPAHDRCPTLSPTGDAMRAGFSAQHIASSSLD